MSCSNTICARLTPAGRGAVAVIGLHGENADSVLEQCFRPAQGAAFSQAQVGKIVYGIWQSTGEDLIVTRRSSDHFEVHCHGGNTACAAILKSLHEFDVREVSAAEYAQSFDDSWSVSTRLALAESTTVKTAKILLEQTRILPAAIDQMKRLIDSNETEAAIALAEKILRWSDFGIHLTQPRSIVLCGQPNVGKSSLVNAIVGFQRAIVHHVAGTTRDVVSQITAIDGWPVELKDTAGLRGAEGPIEAIGIEKARSEIASADFKICVFDFSHPWTRRDQDLVVSIDPHLIVYNKTDLAGEDLSKIERPTGLKTSVETGQGIDTLVETIGSQLVPELPEPGQAIPVTVSQQRKLIELVSLLKGPAPTDATGVYDL